MLSTDACNMFSVNFGVLLNIHATYYTEILYSTYISNLVLMYYHNRLGEYQTLLYSVSYGF